MFYTNADSLLNKRDELMLCLNIEKPDVVLVCEVIPKGQKLPITAKCLEIQGYRNALTNFNPEDQNLGTCQKRGLAVYTREHLSVIPVEVASDFNEKLIVKVKLHGSDKPHSLPHL